MSVIVQKGEYKNLNLKNMNPGHSIVVTVNGITDIDNNYGESKLFHMTCHRVLDQDSNVYEELNDAEAGVFLNLKTKYTQELLAFLQQNEGQRVIITLDRIVSKEYEIKGKGKVQRYVPEYSFRMDSQATTKAPEGASTSQSLPVDKTVFIYLAREKKIPFDGVFELNGGSYKVSDFVSREEYEA